MLTLDGAQGEGGGQVLRTTLALAILTGTSVRLKNIRAKRAKPGLLRQHLTAVQAAAAISDADVDGVALGSGEIVFRPHSVKPGEYRFAIGSAGSTMLVLQTVLPPLMTAAAPSTLILEGGTHNPLAPPFEFLQHAFLPLLARVGPRVELTLERPGFYPAGGGRIVARITPAATLSPLVLMERGELEKRRATALVAGLPGDIAKRELTAIRHALQWDESELALRTAPPDAGPGNVVWLELASTHVTEVFTAFGEKRISAETVAAEAVAAAQSYLAAGVPVGEHLADQLQIPIALAGGAFRTTTPSLHTTTNAAVIRALLGVEIRLTPESETAWRIERD